MKMKLKIQETLFQILWQYCLINKDEINYDNKCDNLVWTVYMRAYSEKPKIAKI